MKRTRDAMRANDNAIREAILAGRHFEAYVILHTVMENMQRAYHVDNTWKASSARLADDCAVNMREHWQHPDAQEPWPGADQLRDSGPERRVVLGRARPIPRRATELGQLTGAADADREGHAIPRHQLPALGWPQPILRAPRTGCACRLGDRPPGASNAHSRPPAAGAGATHSRSSGQSSSS